MVSEGFGTWVGVGIGVADLTGWVFIGEWIVATYECGCGRRNGDGVGDRDESDAGADLADLAVERTLDKDE